MKTIAIIFLSLCLASNALPRPPKLVPKRPIYLSYQDSRGPYSFGYSDPMSARSEYRASDGVTRGTYSYIDNDGLIQTAEYEAGKNIGFRIKATNLPEAPLPVQDTPEVKAAREKHLQLVNAAKTSDGSERTPRGEEEIKKVQAMAEAKSADAQKDVEMIESAVQMKLEMKPAVTQPKAVLNMEAKPQIKIQSAGESMLSSVPAVPAPAIQSLPVVLPEHVKYTPEVMAAREAHLRAYENAARLAIESDLNPQLLEQLLRGQASGVQLSLQTENKLGSGEMNNLPELQKSKEDAKPMQVPSVSENMMMDSMTKSKEQAAQRMQVASMTKSLGSLNTGSGLYPASTSFRIADTRLPSLNEFEQTKLKAGAYSTPIEISHVSPTNMLPFLYPSISANSVFQYVYL